MGMVLVQRPGRDLGQNLVTNFQFMDSFLGMTNLENPLEKIGERLTKKGENEINFKI
jgi:hypothetical protein